MRAINRFLADTGQVIVTVVATLFFCVFTWASYVRWANFDYRTFDLAYYVQGVWQLIHGRFHVSVLNVPLLGNHVEPIVFLFAPFFALVRHPMLFVVVQNAALAAMAPIGYRIAKQLGLDAKRAVVLAIAILIAPATGYVALHEFHPEALAAPLLLLMVLAGLTNKLRLHWIWFVAVLACKENMALLLAAYCAVQLVAERGRGLAKLRAWYLYPMAVAILWFVICTTLIAPALNSGNVDYLALYDRLGTSPGNILKNAVVHPQLIGKALLQSLAQGNLVWALLFPFLCLPLLQPRWLLIATPVLLQHLLSWRSSEWTIYFHYGAPLLPFFWIALVQAVVRLDHWESIPPFVRRVIPILLIAACLGAQILWGPAPRVAAIISDWSGGTDARTRKNAFLSKITANTSVLAPLPYLSHLAMREKLYSLHHVLKGLNTLSRDSYTPPPPTDFVFIDYDDSATFDATAGFYHPAMKTADGWVVPSSDQLLHDFLKRRSWMADSADELTLLRQTDHPTSPKILRAGPVFAVGGHTQLLSVDKTGDVLSSQVPIEIRLNWSFQGQRDVFPWMFLRLARHGQDDRAIITKGLCAPQSAGPDEEIWRITSVAGLAPGDYAVEAIFVDNARRTWWKLTGRGNSPSEALLAKPVPLGDIKVVDR